MEYQFTVINLRTGAQEIATVIADDEYDARDILVDQCFPFFSVSADPIGEIECAS